MQDVVPELILHPQHGLGLDQVHEPFRLPSSSQGQVIHVGRQRVVLPGLIAAGAEEGEQHREVGLLAFDGLQDGEPLFKLAYACAVHPQASA